MEPITSVDLVNIYLDEIERHNGYLKAVICTAPRKGLEQQASQLDEARRAGRLRSRLHGIPILIKDNVATHPSLGMETTAGALALRGSKPKCNADIVDKLIDAGAIIIGKANLSELGFFKGEGLPCGWSMVGGQTQSAYVRGGVQPDDTPGGHSNPTGSSSGSAVAVSAGLCPVSIGTETAGSLVEPSSRAALYTIRATPGLIQQKGIVPLSSLFDTAGPITKSVVDLADLMDILVNGPSTDNLERSYRSYITKSWADIGVAAVNPSIWKLPESFCRPVPAIDEQLVAEYERAYRKIESLARNFRGNVPLPTTEALQMNDGPAFKKVCDESKVRSLEELVAFNKAHPGEQTFPSNSQQSFLEAGLNHKWTDKDVNEALTFMRRVARDEGIDKILQDSGADVIIGPANSGLPTIAAAAGYPIATLPLGYADYNGRPFGLAAIARAHQEGTLIRLQSAWEVTFEPRFQVPKSQRFWPSDEKVIQHHS
ncbi:amidase signature enzyme [Pseudovirgaria hyperparasitica]|uniref:Amidase signature enzyme n=1 Tax=Pseudovirgaria hyperparasitica TaxID=470096 RepID=A0A6A6W3Q0_9PEZI|nr:amidase signature enzyme [Pseudovirgaria hyperparasitica]KAF2756644.1 amidase signature enzyme [Pseudovirgaria hyperparasitica]